MKKALFIMALALVSVTMVSAQMKEGKIVYERKVNMYRSITDPEMRARIPEFRTDKFELLFNGQSSLYRTAADDEAPDPFANNGGDRGGQRFNFRGMEATIFTDIAGQTQYEARAFLEKEFLIVDSTKTFKWKISDETKTIAKYLCKKATTTISAPQMTMRFGGGGRAPRANRDSSATPAMDIKPKEVEVAVWYTEQIPVSVGPDNYAGLPGAILEIDNDNGASVTSAVEITAKYPKKELVQPTKGEKMTRAQFQENLKKIMEEMQKGGGMRMGGMSIRTSN